MTYNDWLALPLSQRNIVLWLGDGVAPEKIAGPALAWDDLAVRGFIDPRSHELTELGEALLRVRSR